MADDVEVTFLGQGTFHGIPAVRRFMAFSASLLQRRRLPHRHCDRRRRRRLRLWEETATTRDGKPWENHGVDVIRVRDGRIVVPAREQRRAARARALPALRGRRHDAADVGLVLGSALAPETLPRLSRLAEELGYGELWFAEDYFFTGGISGAAAALARHRADPDRPRRRLGDGPPSGAAGDGDRDARPHVPGPAAPGHRHRRAGLDAPDGRSSRARR